MQQGLVVGIAIEPEFRPDGTTTSRYFGKDKRIAIISEECQEWQYIVGVPRPTHGRRTAQRHPPRPLLGVRAPRHDPPRCNLPGTIECTTLLPLRSEDVGTSYGKLSESTIKKVDRNIRPWLSDYCDPGTLAYALGRPFQREPMPYGAVFWVRLEDGSKTLAINISNPIIHSRRTFDVITYVLTSQLRHGTRVASWVTLHPEVDPVDVPRIVLHRTIASMAVGDGCAQFLGILLDTNSNLPVRLGSTRMNEIASRVFDYLGLNRHG